MPFYFTLLFLLLTRWLGGLGVCKGKKGAFLDLGLFEGDKFRAPLNGASVNFGHFEAFKTIQGFPNVNPAIIFYVHH